MFAKKNAKDYLFKYKKLKIRFKRLKLIRPKNDYFLVVSFLVVSALAVVSFLVVSTAAFAESAAFTESAVEVLALPLQAVKETAIANAKKLTLIEFFMCYIFNDFKV